MSQVKAVCFSTAFQYTVNKEEDLSSTITIQYFGSGDFLWLKVCLWRAQTLYASVGGCNSLVTTSCMHYDLIYENTN